MVANNRRSASISADCEEIVVAAISNHVEPVRIGIVAQAAEGRIGAQGTDRRCREARCVNCEQRIGLIINPIKQAGVRWSSYGQEANARDRAQETFHRLCSPSFVSIMFLKRQVFHQMLHGLCV